MNKFIKMEIPSKYIDEIYNYAGRWGIPSHCGIKIVKKPSQTIVIATELYETNPGTSVTDFTAQLANYICKNEGIDPAKMVFIEHTPDKKSKLEFYKETFDIVEFDLEEQKFSNPKWNRVAKEEVDEMIEKKTNGF